MKRDRSDVAAGLLLKAESDLANARTCLAAGQALDTVCFHAQQAAEKAIKAYLTAQNVEYPFIHNIEKLVNLCFTRDDSFSEIKALGQTLTPYAVGLRYDHQFWPSADTAREAVETAVTIVEFVRQRLPESKA